MNINSVNSTNNEQKEYEYQSSTSERRDGEMSFKENLEELLRINNLSLNPDEQNLLMNNMSNFPVSRILDFAKDLSEIKSSFNFNTMTMDKDDAIFFVNLTENHLAQLTNNGGFQVEMASISENKEVFKSHNISKTLLDMIENSYKTQKSIRLDFDNNISVIMKVDKTGKITAEFIPSDKVAEEYLKNNIGFLRTTFDEQKLPYNELSYRQQKNNNQRNNKEKRDE